MQSWSLLEIRKKGSGCGENIDCLECVVIDTYLGIDFACNGAWDVCIKKVIHSGRTKLNQLHSVISNRSINLSARRMLLLAVVRPSLQYGNEVWECNKGQANAYTRGC